MVIDFDGLKQEHQRLWAAHERRTLPLGDVQAFLDQVASYLRAAETLSPSAAAERTSNLDRLYGWVQYWGEYLRSQGHSALNSMAGWVWSDLRFLGSDPVHAPPEVDLRQRKATFKLASGAAIQVPFLAPPSPEALVGPRRELLNNLAERLVAHYTLVLYGKTGVGKSVLARSLVYHRRVLSSFRDGVLYAALGRRSGMPGSADVYEALGAWCQTLGMTDAEVAALTTQQQRHQALQARIGTRRMLLVVDDVWDADDARMMQCGGPNTGYLLTTYDRELAEAVVGPEGELGREIELVQPLDKEGNQLLLQEMLRGHDAPQPSAAVDELIDLPSISPMVLELLAHAVKYTERKDLSWWLEQLASVTSPMSRGTGESDVSGEPSRTEPDRASAEDPLLEKTLTLLIETVGEAGRAALRALSLMPPHPSHFSHEAAGAITGNARLVTQLARCGLLLKHSKRRLMMHSFITATMRPQLERRPEELARARRKMVDYYFGFTIEHQKDYPRLCVDHANIVEALAIPVEGEADGKVRKLFVDTVNAHHGYLMAKGLYDLTRENLTRSVTIASQLPYPEGECNSEHHLGDVLEKCGLSAEADEHLDRALGLGRSLNESVLVCRVLERLAAVALQQGYYSQAEAFLQEGEELGAWIQKDEPEAYCRLLLRRGVLETNRNRDAMAQEYNQRGLDLARSANLRELECAAWLNIGILLFYQGEYAKAEEADQRALRLAREIPDREREVGILQAVGGVAIATGEFLRAQRYLEESLDLAQQLGHHWYVGIIQKELGELYLKLRKPGLAIQAFLEAERIGRGTTTKTREVARDQRLVLAETPDLVAFALFGRARTAAYVGDHPQAITLAEQSLRFAERIGHRLQFQVRAWLTQQREVEALISGS